MPSANQEENIATESENYISNLSRRSLQLDDVIDDLNKYMSTENEESDCDNKEDSLIPLSDKEDSMITSTNDINEEIPITKLCSEKEPFNKSTDEISSREEADLSTDKLTENKESLLKNTIDEEDYSQTENLERDTFFAESEDNNVESMNEDDGKSHSYENKEEHVPFNIQLDENANQNESDKKEAKNVEDTSLSDVVSTPKETENVEDIKNENNQLSESPLNLDDVGNDQKDLEESKSTEEKNVICLKENQSLPNYTDEDNIKVEDIAPEINMKNTKENQGFEKDVEGEDDAELIVGGSDVDEEDNKTDKDLDVEIKDGDFNNSSISEEEAFDDKQDVNSEKSSDITLESPLKETSIETEERNSDHKKDEDTFNISDEEKALNISGENVEEVNKIPDSSEENLENNQNDTNSLQDEKILKEIITKESVLGAGTFLDSVNCCEASGEHTCKSQVDNTVQSDDLDDDIEALLANLDGLEIDNDELANDLLNEIEPKTKDASEIKKYKFKICTSLASMDRHMVSRTNKIIAILLAQEEITEEHLELCDIGTDESYKKLWYRKAIDAVNRNPLALPGLFRENGAGNDDIFIGNFEMIFEYNEQFTIEEHLWPETKNQSNEEEESNNILMRLLGKKM